MLKEIVISSLKKLAVILPAAFGGMAVADGNRLVAFIFYLVASFAYDYVTKKD